ncbi:MAG: hypothetical protein V1887_04135 [Candidatus Aenigmatarchaeota archaeon]
MAVEILAAGFLGGLIRVLLAARKNAAFEKLVPAILASGIIGAMSAAAFMFMAPAVIQAGMTALTLAAVLAGYVGADVVESLYKIRAARGGRLL